MIHPILHRKLSEIVEARRLLRMRWANAVLLGVALVVLAAMLLIAKEPQPLFNMITLALAGLLIIGSIIARYWAGTTRYMVAQLARDIEDKHPELNALVRTAVEQQPGEGGFTYLQERVIDEAATAAARQMWADDLTADSWRRASMARTGVLLALVAVYGWFSFEHMNWVRRPAAQKIAEAKAKANAKPEEKKAPQTFEISVTPGDAEVERGSRLVVEAKFTKDVPADATIVIADAKGGEEKRIPMRLTVDQQVFGGMIAKVDRDSVYRVEFAEDKSKDFSISTFVFPALERADAKITPPEYSKQPVKEIKNTLKVTAMEGSEVAFRFKVNKPVKDAELFGEDKTIIPLKPSADDPTILEMAMRPEKSQKYRLHLVDDKERANKQPPWLTVNVQANQLAKIDVVFPKRDIQVSSIQELPVEAKVSDDLGVRKSGAVFTIAGNTKEVMLSKEPLEAMKKHDVKATLALETESVEPRQLVSYYFWAEDQGPKGEVRRAMSDMFFAEVRHFEDIFREMEAPPSEPGKPQKKSDADKLVELQKQVVNATWRLIRDTNAGKKMQDVKSDVGVVRESEELALNQTKEAMEKAEDAEIKTALTEAWKSMKDALGPLGQAADEKSRSALNQALTYEQQALEWLYRTASREHQVVRQNQKKPSSGGEQQKNERQLMTLELKQKEQRYEEEKAASEEQTAEQQENLQVLSRLKELARRQEALAEKIKELEKQIEKAKSEEEKQELANQMKRLQDEQEQLLRDVDDLKEKMEKSENQQMMADAKEQLEQTREQVLDAAEKLKEEKLAQAANAATRAERELKEMQEDFRKKTSRKFSDEMRQMRDQAREVADAQKKIADGLENQKTETGIPDQTKNLEKMLDGAQAGRDIDTQQERVQKLMEEMRRVSEQAETSEPLLSKSLEEAVRNAGTNGVQENLQETREYARLGERSMAQESERKATKAVDELKKGVERAAESVLGSETEALRMARAELDQLIKQAGEEAKVGQAAGLPDPSDKKAKPGEQQTAQNDKPKPGEGKEGDANAEPKDGKGEGMKPGEGKDGKQLADASQQPKDGAQGEGKDGKPSPDGKGEGQQPGEPKDGKGMADAGQMPKDGEQGQKPGEDKDGQGQKPGEGKDGKQTADAGKPGEKGEGKNGQGEKPGEGKDGKQMAAAGQPGENGEGKPGEGQKPGEGKGQQPGKGEQQTAQNGEGQKGNGRNGQEGQPQGEQAGRTEGDSPSAGGERQAQAGQQRNGARGGGGDTSEREMFFDAVDQAEDRSIVTGAEHDRWSDRLRSVENLLSHPELRNDAARVLDNARALRFESKRDNEAPKAAHLSMRIIEPLMELRDRVAEELAKKDKGNSLAPVDRDPVPSEYRDLVRRYYQELGAGK